MPILPRCLKHSFWFLFFSTGFAQAQTLQSILSSALINDPKVIEAETNQKSAEISVKVARSGHLPTVAVVGNQIVSQRYDDGRATDNKTDVGVEGKLNLWSWGGVNAGVDKEKEAAEYYRHQVNAVKEDLGSTVGQLYLTALRQKDNLAVYHRNLERHNKIIRDLEVIAKYDQGRRYELTQAKARKLQVESNILQTKQAMDLALSQLNRYTATRVTEADLISPFTSMNWTDFVQHYQSPDLTNLPGYQAQHSAVKSAEADLRVNRAAQLPALNLNSYASNDRKEVYFSLSWDIFNLGKHYSVAQSSEAITAARVRAEQILQEEEEQARSAKINMEQNSARFDQTKSLIAAQQQVAKAYELQFKIARRNLIDVLDAYSELSGVELSHTSAQSDYRDAALAYLRSQGKIADWVYGTGGYNAPAHGGNIMLADNDSSATDAVPTASIPVQVPSSLVLSGTAPIWNNDTAFWSIPQNQPVSSTATTLAFSSEKTTVPTSTSKESEIFVTNIASPSVDIPSKELVLRSYSSSLWNIIPASAPINIAARNTAAKTRVISIPAPQPSIAASLGTAYPVEVLSKPTPANQDTLCLFIQEYGKKRQAEGFGASSVNNYNCVETHLTEYEKRTVPAAIQSVTLSNTSDTHLPVWQIPAQQPIAAVTESKPLLPMVTESKPQPALVEYQPLPPAIPLKEIPIKEAPTAIVLPLPAVAENKPMQSVAPIQSVAPARNPVPAQQSTQEKPFAVNNLYRMIKQYGKGKPRTDTVE
ncbi:TolC family protein [Stenoxybacter acetivorans]|uniref:TolC family protein n=1 Tax=Stenoxybacter acetivorans TaxID=422441 RepID=UPI00068C082B|nr:TolC family protein [Stenoxybacter acetivorans]